jgi:membrane protein implicated in regulation of membrane protease activity
MGAQQSQGERRLTTADLTALCVGVIAMIAGVVLSTASGFIVSTAGIGLLGLAGIAFVALRSCSPVRSEDRDDRKRAP